MKYARLRLQKLPTFAFALRMSSELINIYSFLFFNHLLVFNSYCDSLNSCDQVFNNYKRTGIKPKTLRNLGAYLDYDKSYDEDGTSHDDFMSELQITIIVS